MSLFSVMKLTRELSGSNRDGDKSEVVTKDRHFMFHKKDSSICHETLNQTASNGITFLMASCERGSIRSITLSTKSGTGLNIIDKKNQTALHSAVDNLTKQLQVVLHSSWHLVNEAA
ncbi:Hypothetical predicted protein [Octopus vulgaris]|uniref:Uncharacterized protein n=1 Tax=Octopus vulgaris TaxID=6645 RepID=A0AA36B6H9_OCTVU|nr:Hypothetical predicted protein [Octopus vulgaris]